MQNTTQIKKGEKMELNLEAIRELVKVKFRNKLTYLALELDVDYSYLNQIMNNKRTPTSKKVCTRLIKYCIDNGLDYQKYVFIPFQKEFNSANLSLIKTKNNLLKINIAESQKQIEEALQHVNCIDELIGKLGDDIVEFTKEL